MTTTTHIQVRDARDRLIDLLGIGQTYPLQDLAVRDEQLTVAFNTPAKIPIENSQKDVLYQLHHKHKVVQRPPQSGKGPGVPIEAEGNGELILLETNKIQDDVTFDILARKQRSGREAYLHRTATVKVGLDTTLRTWIREVQPLDPTNDGPTAPRIIPYGIPVDVEIENSQEGVDYSLVYLKEKDNGGASNQVRLSAADVRGDLHNIILTTQPVYEDTDIRILATKTFDPSERRKTQTALLDAVLPLKVRANPALPISVEPSPIIAFKQPATITIANSQQSASYRLYLHPIPDRDFIRSAVPNTEVINVGVAGEPDVQVPKPARAAAWTAPEGYIALGEAQAGTGDDLRITIDGLTDDSLVIVQAEKVHQVPQDAQTAQALLSAVQLEQAAAILVQPDPAPPLRIKVWVEAADTRGDLYVFDGQPGVFYHFRRAADGDDLGLPAYFHKRDAQDQRGNKGLDQLAVEVDFVVARGLSSTADGVDPAEIPPESPLLETGRLPLDTPLHIRAVKAQTRVATALDNTLQIPAGPEVEPEKAVVAYGAKTRVRIKASRSGESYQLLANGSPLGEPIKGTGQNRLLDTGELREDTTFELLIRQVDQPIVVERVLSIAVLAQPNPALQTSAIKTIVDYDTATEIQVAASQPGVSYQLMVGEKLVGEPVAGTGDTIALPTGPLIAETTFSIRAAKLATPEIFVKLDQQVNVQVQAIGAV